MCTLYYPPAGPGRNRTHLRDCEQYQDRHVTYHQWLPPWESKLRRAAIAPRAGTVGSHAGALARSGERSVSEKGVRKGTFFVRKKTPSPHSLAHVRENILAREKISEDRSHQPQYPWPARQQWRQPERVPLLPRHTEHAPSGRYINIASFAPPMSKQYDQAHARREDKTGSVCTHLAVQSPEKVMCLQQSGEGTQGSLCPLKLPLESTMRL